MRIAPFYLIAQPVIGVFDAADRLVKEVAGLAVKLYEPLAETAPALLARFAAAAPAQAAGPNTSMGEQRLEGEEHEAEQAQRACNHEETVPERARR